MSWRFRKIFRRGPIQVSLTKNGLGMSVSLLGLCRVGISPTRQFFLSFGIPKTGLYWIHYFGAAKTSQAKEATQLEADTDIQYQPLPVKSSRKRSKKSIALSTAPTLLNEALSIPSHATLGN